MHQTLDAIGHALLITWSMTWEILWALILGFFLAAIVESVVSKHQVSRLLPNGRLRSIATATGLGVASSSCSYAAVALSRALFRKGANFTSAIVFQVASTNLVIELGAILWLLVGWQFALAEYVGGFVMIALIAISFRFIFGSKTIAEAREQAQMGVAGSMEGHAAMDMSIEGGQSIPRRIVSRKGWRAIADNFVMEWAATLRDIVIGLFIAGAIAAWVPDAFWRAFFFDSHPLVAKFWGPFIGPLVAVLSFVCSIGNVPLAGVLWNDGISFGGVVSFIFADLLIIPIVFIYRKYYGWKVALRLFASLWMVMTLSGYVVELLFGATGLMPKTRHAHITEHAHVTWNYTTYLNIVAIALAAGLVFSFWKNGSWSMLKMMNGSPDGHEHHNHDHSSHAAHKEHASDEIVLNLDEIEAAPMHSHHHHH